MSNALYMVRSKKIDRKIDQLIKHYHLDLCYQDGREKIFRGEELLVSLKPRYLFLYPLSSNLALIPKIQDFLTT